LGGEVHAPKQTVSVHTLVLTLLIETHASYRAVQSCLRSLHGISMSLGRITDIVKEAGQRAQRWLEHQQATTPRALAWTNQTGANAEKAICMWLMCIAGTSGPACPQWKSM
jgi:hypothetical protein